MHSLIITGRDARAIRLIAMAHLTEFFVHNSYPSFLSVILYSDSITVMSDSRNMLIALGEIMAKDSNVISVQPLKSRI